MRARLSTRPVLPWWALTAPLPVAVLMALGSVGAPLDQNAKSAITDQLIRQSLGCPAAADKDSRVVFGSLNEGTSAEAEYQLETGQTAISVKRPALSNEVLDEAGVLVARDDLAPGLFAARVSGPVVVPCSEPTTELWWVGLGASPQHASTIHLNNPDRGPAILDISLYDLTGAVEASSVRGVRVPASGSTVLDLAELAPSKTALSARLVAVRGRVSATVVDEFDSLDGKTPVWALNPPVAPTRTPQVLGTVQRELTSWTLTMANPSARTATIRFTVSSASSTFEPSAPKPMRLAPGAVSELQLDKELAQIIKSGGLSLNVVASDPVLAGLSGRSESAAAVLAGQPGEVGPQLAVLGTGKKLLSLSGASGTVDVVMRDQSGKVVFEQSVAVSKRELGQWNLPKTSGVLEVRSDTLVRAVVTGEENTWQRLQPLRFETQFPAVRPGPPS
jgi:hypothetical protein